MIGKHTIRVATRGAAFAVIGAFAAFASPSTANAAASVAWTSPANGASFAVGTSVAPTGSASGSGAVGGTGLDLALVLDSSGSMSTTSGGQSRQQWQRDAAIALVNSLPVSTTSVSVVEFDSNANVVVGLTPLIPASNIQAIIDAINGVDASGGTDIADGIVAGAAELTGPNQTAGRSQQMVVISDGGSSQNAATTAAANALTAGVEAVHTVAIPGANTSTMSAIAAAGNGVFTDFSDPTDLANITSVFDGTGGNLVGLSKVEVTLPDGSVVQVPTDGFGNFTAPSFALALGPNTFVATAFATDGSTATATLVLNGVDTTNVVPLPAAAWMLLAGLGALGVASRRRA